jgi:hypothetical protein
VYIVGTTCKTEIEAIRGSNQQERVLVTVVALKRACAHRLKVKIHDPRFRATRLSFQTMMSSPPDSLKEANDGFLGGSDVAPRDSKRRKVTREGTSEKNTVKIRPGFEPFVRRYKSDRCPPDWLFAFAKKHYINGDD